MYNCNTDLLGLILGEEVFFSDGHCSGALCSITNAATFPSVSTTTFNLVITSRGQGTGTRAEIVMWLWTIVQIISVDPLLNYFVRLVLDVNWLNGLHQPPPARHEAATAAHLIGPLQPRSRAEAELLALLGNGILEMENVLNCLL